MKIEREKKFSPITITLETEEEIKELIETLSRTIYSPTGLKLYDKLRKML
jgi:hypothetical protein